MYFMHNQIAFELAKRLDYEKRLRKLQHQLADQDDEKAYAEVALLERNLAVTDEWLSLLTPEQHYVIQQHLVYGKTWNSIEREYSNQYGDEKALTTDVLFRHHEDGINRITRFLITEGKTFDDQ